MSIYRDFPEDDIPKTHKRHDTDEREETEKDEQKVYTEGTPNQVLVTKYERNPFARKTCIDHYGLSCSVCEFNFENEYGELGKDFIHVHHLRQ